MTALLVCGVDEAGRGPLAGPVIAAAVILDPADPIDGLADSKRLTPRRREGLATEIRRRAVAWSLGRAEASEIDEVNILRASLRAMTRAVAGLGFAPAEVLVDGNVLPELPVPGRAVVGGDATIACISAASILAKVARDAEMCALETLYPGYGFAAHKGYPTRGHLEAIGRLGITPAHRRTFSPVRNVLEKEQEKHNKYIKNIE